MMDFHIFHHRSVLDLQFQFPSLTMRSPNHAGSLSFHFRRLYNASLCVAVSFCHHELDVSCRLLDLHICLHCLDAALLISTPGHESAPHTMLVPSPATIKLSTMLHGVGISSVCQAEFFGSTVCLSDSCVFTVPQNISYPKLHKTNPTPCLVHIPWTSTLYVRLSGKG